MMHRLPLACLLVSLSVASAVDVRAGTAETPPEAVACDIPADLTTPDSPLPHVAAALAANRPVEVLALGSGSTVGDATGNVGPAFIYNRPGESFPFQMIESLHEAHPDATFQLTVKGGRNMTAEDMLPLLRQALAGGHYDLIVWQTGTVEAVRGLRPGSLRDVLHTGIQDAEAAGSDVVIVDPQFSRFLRANVDISPYESALQQIAGMTSAALFRRFDLTQAWATTGRIDLEKVSRDARERTISELNICLGRALARFVLNGAGGAATAAH